MPAIAQEATRATACPLCGREKFCFLIGDDLSSPTKVICQWTEANNPPRGWNYHGLAKDNRPIFIKEGSRKSQRSRFPELVKLTPIEKEAGPPWQLFESQITIGPGDLVCHKKFGDIYTAKQRINRSGKLHFKCTLPGSTQISMEIPEKELGHANHDKKTGAELKIIEYLYPDPITQQPLGKVVRRQWSDRRLWLEGFTKSKEIRPWHWDRDGQHWARGKGERSWPLYRELEAKEAILNGEVVFAVAGEQAVEVYRALGLTATTVQGGEAKYTEIVDRLKECFTDAKEAGKSPILSVHPDFDLTGESKFTEGLVTECRKANIPAVAMAPTAIWAKMPHGGDIKDVVELSGMLPMDILINLETAIDEAIDHQEQAERAIKQRQRWGAPESLQGELGYFIERDGWQMFSPLTNFDLQIEKEVANEEGGGFLLQLKRAGEHHQHRVFLPSLDFTSNVTFENTLKKAFGGALICRLTSNQMKALLRVRLHEYHSRGGKLYRLASRIGQQDDGHWIFPKMQLTAKGEETSEEESRWIWNSNLTGEQSSLPMPHTNPDKPEALIPLVETMQRFFGGNFPAAILTLGYGAASIHYKQFIERSGAFPLLNLIGDGSSGKSTAANCALSLVGMHTEKAKGMMKEVSVSAAYERLKIAGGLLHCLDDPERKPELDEFLKGLYNGKARVVRGKESLFNSQVPHSAMMVASNFACGESNAATMSRLIQLWFDVDANGDLKTYPELENCWKNSSGALAELIRWGYQPDGMKEVEQKLQPYLPHAHARMSRSLSILLYYAERICQFTGCRIDLMDYVLNRICVMANDVDASTDSLRDFIEKLSILRSQTKVGEWNMRFVTDHNSDRVKCLVINLPSVWDAIDRNYKLSYNLRIIKNLLFTRGLKEGRQKFHRDEDVSKAFERKQTDDPKWTIKRCVEIPIDLIKDYVEISLAQKSMSTESTELMRSDKTLEPYKESQLTINTSFLSTECQLSQLRLEEGVNDSTSNTQDPVDKLNPVDTSVDMGLSTDQSHARQELEPVLEAQLTQLTRKIHPDIEPPSDGDAPIRPCLFFVGQNVRYMGDSVTMERVCLDKRLKVVSVNSIFRTVEVEHPSWAVTHHLGFDDLIPCRGRASRAENLSAGG